MNRPRAILFDFGGTLLGDRRYDPEKGYARLLGFTDSTHTSEEVQAASSQMGAELEEHYGLIELPFQTFLRTLFDLLGIQFRISLSEMELEFWKGVVRFSSETGIASVLEDLKRMKIQMAVVSNNPF